MHPPPCDDAALTVFVLLHERGAVNGDQKVFTGDVSCEITTPLGHHDAAVELRLKVESIELTQRVARAALPQQAVGIDMN